MSVDMIWLGQEFIFTAMVEHGFRQVLNGCSGQFLCLISIKQKQGDKVNDGGLDKRAEMNLTVKSECIKQWKTWSTFEQLTGSLCPRPSDRTENNRTKTPDI